MPFRSSRQLVAVLSAELYYYIKNSPTKTTGSFGPGTQVTAPLFLWGFEVWALSFVYAMHWLHVWALWTLTINIVPSRGYMMERCLRNEVQRAGMLSNDSPKPLKVVHGATMLHSFGIQVLPYTGSERSFYQFCTLHLPSINFKTCSIGSGNTARLFSDPLEKGRYF